MSKRTGSRRLLMLAGAALALTVSLVVPQAVGHAATGESLSVDLSSTRGPSTGVGEGFLYGISEDGTQPTDQFLQPLGINAFRGGGWFSGGWIKDNYQYGSATSGGRQLDHRAGAAAHPAALPRAVPGAGHRHVRPQRWAAVEHDVSVRQRQLLELGQFHRRHRGRVAGIRSEVRLRHRQRAGHLDLLEGWRQQHPVLPDVGHRLPGDPADRAGCADRRSLLRIHSAAQPG